MDRSAHFAAAVTVAGCAAFFLTAPGGIRDAQGCSGASWTWTAPGWHSASWSADPTGVPTDGAVRLKLEANYKNYGSGSGGGGDVAITVRGSDNALVPGSPETAAAPATKTTQAGSTIDSTITVTWQPAAPFLPSATYTLQVKGLLGGAVDLPFTTGAGPFAPPKPIMANPSLSVSTSYFSGQRICCQLPAGPPYYCGGTEMCVSQMIQPAPSISAQIDVDEPVAAAKTFLTPQLQVSVNGESFWSAPSSTVDLVGADGTICARVLATNTLTQATALSPEWCGNTNTLDLSASPNCPDMAAVLTMCGVTTGGGGAAGAPTGAVLSPDARSVYQDVCGSAGSAGTGGSGGNAEVSADAGSAAGMSGLPNPRAAADTVTIHGSGCAVATRSRRGGDWVFAAMFLGLAATLRARTRR